MQFIQNSFVQTAFLLSLLFSSSLLPSLLALYISGGDGDAPVAAALGHVITAAGAAYPGPNLGVQFQGTHGGAAGARLGAAEQEHGHGAAFARC